MRGDSAFVLPKPHWKDVRSLADRGETVPPKSTYIEPKFAIRHHFVRMGMIPLIDNLHDVQAKLPSHVTLVAVSKNQAH